jgi:hypothetical protein
MASRIIDAHMHMVPRIAGVATGGRAENLG